MIDLIIKNGKIIDGTGEPPYTSDIAVDNGKIIQIGDSSSLNSKKTARCLQKVRLSSIIRIFIY